MLRDREPFKNIIRGEGDNEIILSGTDYSLDK